MPKFNTMVPSKYLKQSDFEQPALLTITEFAQENIAQEGQPEERKWTVYFAELEKGMVLNATNLQLIQVATGTDSSEAAIGRKIVVYVDPNIAMGGKLVGGLRIRAPKNRVAAQPAPAPLPPNPATAPCDAEGKLVDPDSDDVPF